MVDNQDPKVDMLLKARARLPRILGLAALAAVAIYFVAWTDAAIDIDDAMITYRYAENLAAGNGFVYNQGERILGTTTPLYTILIAMFNVASISSIDAGTFLNLLCSTLLILLLAVTAARWSGSAAAGALAAMVLGLHKPFLTFSMSGMETPLYALTILGVLWSYGERRFMLAAILAGAAALTRIDGLIIAAVYFLLRYSERHRIPWSEVITFTAVALPWYLFALIYFGSPIPNSLAAKQAEMLTSAHPNWPVDAVFGAMLGGPNYLIYLAPIGAAGLLLSGYREAARLAISWVIFYLAAYLAFRIEYYEWYILPLSPVLALFIAAGFKIVVELCLRFVRSPAWSYTVKSAAVIAAACLLLPYLNFARDAVRAHREYLEDIELRRARIGSYLGAMSGGRGTLYTTFIGHLGYHSKMHIADGGGIVTPLGKAQTAEIDFAVTKSESEIPAGCRLLNAERTGIAGPGQWLFTSKCGD